MAEERAKENTVLAGRVFREYLNTCNALDEKAAEEVAAVASKVLRDAPDRIRQHPRDAVFWALQTAYTTASDDSASPIERRQCFNVLTTILGRLDQIRGLPSRQSDEPIASTAPPAESLTPEQTALRKARESAAASNPPDETAAVETGVAASVPPPPPPSTRANEAPSPSPQNHLPQKRPAEGGQGSMDAARADAPSAAAAASSSSSARISGPSFETSPLHRKRAAPASMAIRWTPPAANRTGLHPSATEPFPPLPNLKAAAPPAPALGPQPPTRERGNSSAATVAAASGRRAPSEEAPSQHRRENGRGAASASSSGSANLKPPPPESAPNGHLKPPARPQVTAPTTSRPPTLLAEKPKAKDPPNAGGTAAPASLSTSQSRARASGTASAGEGARPARPPPPTEAKGGTRSRSRSPDRSASLSVPRKPSALIPSDAGTAPAAKDRGASISASSGGTQSRDPAAAPPRLRPAHEANGSVGSDSAGRSQSVKGSVDRSTAERDASGRGAGHRSESAEVAATSRRGHDRDPPIPRRDKSSAPPPRREAPTSNGAPRRGAAAIAKPDVMYRCLRRYETGGIAERKSFVAQADTNRFSGALEERDRVKLEFEQTSASITEALAVIDRLQRWDPYWEFAGPVLIGKLGRILVPALETPYKEGEPLNEAFTAKAVKLTKAGKLLRTAMRLSFTPNTDLKQHDARDVFALIPFPSWHNPQRTTFENGEAHLILRMLPVDHPSRSATSNSSYLSRADCHIWPKGTFLQHNGTPVKLPQRKLDRTNRTWKHVKSTDELQVLDLTPRIQDPRTEQVLDLCCYDDEPFYYCLSICKYRSHETLFRSLTSESSPDRLPTVRYSDGLARIIELAKPVLLDGVEETSPGDDNFAYYSFLCPISKNVMTIPVRGRQCSHFQCFDVKNFVVMYTHPGASRWRCGVLECNRFLSLGDLVVCQLTAETLKEERHRISPNRFRMRFDTSGKHRLVRDEPKPPPRRQEVPAFRSSSNRPSGRNGAATDSEPIDLL